MRRLRTPARGRAAQPGADHLPGSAARKRRSEVFNLAFLLLGGRQAATTFLSDIHPRLAARPGFAAMKSPWGLVEVVRVLRREAQALAPETDRW